MGPGGKTIEEVIAEAVTGVLGETDPETPLPATGATSIQLAAVCARVAAALDRPVPMREFLQRPTAADLAHWLRTQPRTAHAAGLTDLGEGPGAVALGHFPAMCLFRQMVNPDDRADYCTLTWIVHGCIDRAVLLRAVQEVQCRHEALRARYLFKGRPLVLPVEADSAEPPPLADAEASSIEEGLATVRAHLAAPLDLEAGRVWRAALCTVGPATSVLGVVVHHVAFDGWSESVLAADLGRAYAAGLAGRARSMGPAVSLREADRLATAHDHAANLDGQRSAAARFLRGVEELRLDRAPYGTATHDGGTTDRGTGDNAARTLSLPMGQLPGLRLEPGLASGSRTRMTSFVVQLAAYATALREVSGQDDFALGVPVRRRFDARLHEAVGNHVNMVPVRLGVPVRPGARAAIEATAAAVDEAFGIQDLALTELVQLLRVRRAKGNPLYQHVFAFQDNPPVHLELPGARCELRRHGYLLDIATDTMAEVWPPGRGYDTSEYTVALTYRAGRVSATVARELLTAYAETVRNWKRKGIG